MVDAADVLQIAVGLITGQVTGAVQAFAGCGERIGHVFFGGHRRAAEVTTGDARAAQVQLCGDALGDCLQISVEQVAGGVFEGPANVRQCRRRCGGSRWNRWCLPRGHKDRTHAQPLVGVSLWKQNLQE